MQGQMQWRSTVPGGTKVLHFRTSPQAAWQPHWSWSSQKKPPTSTCREVSAGWNLYQHLNRLGWELVASDDP